MDAVLDRVLAVALLALLAARPLISESFEPLQVSFLSALQTAGGPTPAATAGLDTVSLGAAVLVLARQQRWRQSRPIALGVVALAIAVVVSTYVAGDRPLALRAGSNLVVIAVSGTALAALVRSRAWHRLLLAALLATGATTGVKCLNQHWVENRDVQADWERIYKPHLIQRGFDLEDPLLVNFERRMQAGEVYGFLSHPNITGSCAMMWALVAGGLLLSRLAAATRRTAPAAPRSPGEARARVQSDWLAVGLVVLLCALFALTVWFTGSRGALVAGALGVLLMLGFGLAAGWCARHARTVLAILVTGYLALIGGAAAYGLTRGTLPHPSLAFRWFYWTAAAHAIHDAPWTGIGRGNFATAYLQYKDPASTEDVRDPHNLWLSLLTELGPLGLFGGVLLSGGCLVRGLRRLAPPTSPAPSADVPTGRRMVLLALGLLLVHAIFSGTDFANPGELWTWVFDIAVPWPIAFAAALWLLRDADHPGWLVAGLTAALIAALTHSLLDFALLTPGGLAVFVLCGVGTGRTAANVGARGRPAAPLLVGLLFVAAHAWFVSGPAYTTTRALEELDTTLRTPSTDPGANPVLAAAERVVSQGQDATVAHTAARAVLQTTARPQLDDRTRLGWLDQAQRYVGIATLRNSRDSNHFSLRAAIQEQMAVAYERLGQADPARQARRAAAESWEEAVQRNPTSPRGLASAGRAWFEVWQRDQDPEAARRARQHLETALRIDDLRPVQEVVRLRPQEREPVIERLRRLSATTAPPASQP